MTSEEIAKIDQALARLDTIERRGEVMQVRQEYGQAAVDQAQADLKEIKADVKALVNTVADNRLEHWKSGGLAAAITVAINAIGWKASQ
jgi:hypothetical protein